MCFQVSAATYHTAFVTQNGTLGTFGCCATPPCTTSDFGQCASFPKLKYQAVAASDYATCALTAAGSIVSVVGLCFLKRCDRSVEAADTGTTHNAFRQLVWEHS